MTEGNQKQATSINKRPVISQNTFAILITNQLKFYILEMMRWNIKF
jgi:hypothetical protein